MRAKMEEAGAEGGGWGGEGEREGEGISLFAAGKLGPNPFPSPSFARVSGTRTGGRDTSRGARRTQIVW